LLTQKSSILYHKHKLFSHACMHACMPWVNGVFDRATGHTQIVLYCSSLSSPLVVDAPASTGINRGEDRGQWRLVGASGQHHHGFMAWPWPPAEQHVKLGAAEGESRSRAQRYFHFLHPPDPPSESEHTVNNWAGRHSNE
jgi:hypothetical protein